MNSSAYHRFGFREIQHAIDEDFTAFRREFQIRTLNNVVWFIAGRRRGLNNKRYEITFNLDSEIFPNEKIDLSYKLTVENHHLPSRSITMTGETVFTGGLREALTLKLEKIEEMFIPSNGFMDSSGCINFKFSFKVNASNIYNIVELLDLYSWDPISSDCKLPGSNPPLFVSKPLLTLQSKTLAEILEKEPTKDIEKFYKSIDTVDIHDFFQLLHGVDISLDDENIEEHWALAKKFQVPRIIEMCKDYLTGGSRLGAYERCEIAEKNEFPGFTELLLNAAQSLNDIKTQKWDLESFSDENIKLLAGRIFAVIEDK